MRENDYFAGVASAQRRYFRPGKLMEAKLLRVGPPSEDVTSSADVTQSVVLVLQKTSLRSTWDKLSSGYLCLQLRNQTLS